MLFKYLLFVSIYSILLLTHFSTFSEAIQKDLLTASINSQDIFTEETLFEYSDLFDEDGRIIQTDESQYPNATLYHATQLEVAPFIFAFGFYQELDLGTFKEEIDFFTSGLYGGNIPIYIAFRVPDNWFGRRWNNEIYLNGKSFVNDISQNLIEKLKHTKLLNETNHIHPSLEDSLINGLLDKFEKLRGNIRGNSIGHIPIEMIDFKESLRATLIHHLHPYGSNGSLSKREKELQIQLWTKMMKLVANNLSSEDKDTLLKISAMQKNVLLIENSINSLESETIVIKSP